MQDLGGQGFNLGSSPTTPLESLANPFQCHGNGWGVETNGWVPDAGRENGQVVHELLHAQEQVLFATRFEGNLTEDLVEDDKVELN